MLTPDCPRCGYDQSGVIATWTDSCPLRGTCSECGLEFAFADVAEPKRRVCDGHYEHAEHWWNVHAALQTFWWALYPPRFWDQIKLRHRVIMHRLVLWVLVLAFAGWVGGTLLPWLMDELRVSKAKGWSIDWGYAFRALAEPFDAALAQVPMTRTLIAPRHDSWLPSMSAVVWVALLAGFTVMLLPDMRARAKVKRRHVLRAMVFSLAPLAIELMWWTGHQWSRLIDAMYPPAPRGSQWAWTIHSIMTYHPWITLAVLLWTCWWWWNVIGKGWRISPARPVRWVLVTIIALGMLVLEHGACVLSDKRSLVQSTFNWIVFNIG